MWVSFGDGTDRARAEVQTASAWWIYGVLPDYRPGLIKLLKSFVIESQLSGRRTGCKVGTYVGFRGSITGGKAIGTGSGELRLKEIVRI